MFPEFAESNESTKKQSLSKLPPKKKLLVYGLAAAILLLLVAAVVLAISLMKAQAVKVPDEIARNFKSSIYLPSKLPGNYKLGQSTFSVAEENSVLIFHAKDGVSGDLVFSEQAKPKDFNFDNFHKGNFEEPKTLSGVPHPSVWGKAADGRLALSIVTDDTWILMATTAPLNADDIQAIAKGIKKQ